MAGLQRSVETFRRSGSSGLVWEDRLSEDANQEKEEKKKKKKDKEQQAGELRRSRSTGSTGMIQRSHSNGFRTSHVPPALDPPSPKVSMCGFCGVFGKPASSKKSKPTKRTK